MGRGGSGGGGRGMGVGGRFGGFGLWVGGYSFEELVCRALTGDTGLEGCIKLDETALSWGSCLVGRIWTYSEAQSCCHDSNSVQIVPQSLHPHASMQSSSPKRQAMHPPSNRVSTLPIIQPPSAPTALTRYHSHSQSAPHPPLPHQQHHPQP